MRSGFADEQRLAFGRVAELYDRARPSYPGAAVDDVLSHAELAPGDRVLEVGAGTGKLTVLLAERGLEVTALEPSAEMAAVARVRCPSIDLVEREFEAFEAPRPFPAIVAAAAWHWVDPERRYACAHRALQPGGTLAGLWTFPAWPECRLRAALSDAYRAAVPGMKPDFPMHPDSQPESLVGARPGRVRDGGHWEREIEDAAGLFEAPEARLHRWANPYTSHEYVDLLQTHQDHILLGPAARRRLLEAVAAAVDAAGGAFELPLVTHVCLARRV